MIARIFSNQLTHYSKVQALAIIVALGFVLANSFIVISSHFQSVASPLNDFLLLDAPGSDFIDPWLTVKDFSPYRLISAGGVYFPVAYLFFLGLSKLPLSVAMFTYIALFMIGLFALNRYFFGIDRSSDYSNSYSSKGYLPQIITLTCLSYPVLFCLTRGNIEGLVFILVALALICYRQQRWLASVCLLAVATAMKGYPGAFCVLFLSDKRYKELGIFIVLVFSLSLGSLLLFKDSVSFSVTHLMTNLQYFNYYFILSDRALLFNSSLYGFFKTGYLMAQHIPWRAHYVSGAASLWAYSGFALVLLSGLSAYVVWVEKIFWRKVAIVVAMILLLPQIAFDYRQLFLYLPIYYFVNDTSNFKRCQDGFYVGLFGLLLIPKNYFPLYGKAGIGSGFTVILLLILAISLISSGLNSAHQRRCSRALQL